MHEEVKAHLVCWGQSREKEREDNQVSDKLPIVSAQRVWGSGDWNRALLPGWGGAEE